MRFCAVWVFNTCLYLPWCLSTCLCILCASLLLHPCLHTCLSVCRLKSARGIKQQLVISVLGGWGLAWGTMIRTLNQTPRSYVTGKSCSFNFFWLVDTNKLDMTPYNINQPLQEIWGCCSRGFFYATCTVSVTILWGFAIVANLTQHNSSF